MPGNLAGFGGGKIVGDIRKGSHLRHGFPPFRTSQKTQELVGSGDSGMYPYQRTPM